MSDPTNIKLPKWPFFLGDAVLLILACFFLSVNHGAMPETLLALFCALMGSLLAVTPFVLEYHAAVKMVETGALVSILSQIQNAEEIAKQIGGATSQWQGIQEQAVNTAAIAKELT